MDPFYLKKIDIFGFKSFSDKTEVLFNKGVTCIVGPNGCGKSNIADAIRWVLGERSPKHLRGSQMSDVIFAGTEIRKPLSMAEVDLTFDNQSRWLPIDYNEVTISRRLYRTGEGEYLINKTRCRYRDILALLADTGLGVGSYSMIEQGRVDYILNADPEDRRGLIEEAAGVAKYRAQKEETIRKLAHTEENSIRLKDIVQEVERNIKYAERQAKRAERYRSQLEELRRMDITKAFMDMAHITEDRQAVSADLSTLKAQIIAAEERQLTERSRREELELAIAKLESSIRGELDRRAVLRGNHEHLRGQIVSLKNRLEEFDSETRRTEEELRELDVQSAKLKQQREEAIAQASTDDDVQAEIRVQKAYEEKKTELNQEKAALEGRRSEIDRAREEIFDAADRLLKTKNELQRLETDLDHDMKSRERFSDALTRREKELDDVRNELAIIEKHENDAGGHEHQMLDEFEARRGRNKEIETQSRLLTGDLEKLQNRLSELKAHASAVKGLAKKGLLSWPVASAVWNDQSEFFKPFEKLTEVVAEVIHPKKGYEHLYRLALGKFADAVFMKDSDAADRLMESLAQEKLGEAFVLLADQSAAPFFQKDGLAGHPLILGPAIDFVECAPEHRKLAEIILTGTYFAVSWTGSNRRQLRALALRARLITQDGIILGPGGRIHGSFSQTTDDSYRFTDLAAWKNLQADIETQQTKIDSIKSNLDALRHELVELESWFHESDGDIRSARVATESAGKVKTQLLRELKRIEDEIRLIQNDVAETYRNEEVARARTNPLKQELGGFEKAEETHKKRLSELTIDLDRLEREKDRIARESTMLAAELDHIRSHGAEGAVSYASIQNHIDRTESEKELKVKLLQDIAAKKSTASESIRKSEEELARQSNEEEMCVNALNRLELNIQELKEAHRNSAASIEVLHRGLASLKDGEHEKTLAHSELAHRAQTIHHQIYQVHKVKLDELHSTEFPPPSSDEMPDFEERYSELKRNVESMGAVNLLAVEEYEELKTRYDFLAAQQKDLEMSRESLLEAVRKINRTTRKLFHDTFLQVQSYFEQYYRILFRGGHGELILMDESNPLESGIDIHVRPPGKKLQHVSLLSGGEKAMTAIALLFALFKVKPSPFCVLDEVDAPLDEANIDRFLDVLREFLSGTQFLIITHNRRTITSGDTLYGVTMEESGVSKIVSVRMMGDEKKSVAESRDVATQVAS